MQCVQDQQHDQIPKGDSPTRHKSSAHLDPNQVAWTLIDVGLVKTHAKCLPGDIVFVPYQLDNVVYHFPLPPGSQAPKILSSDASTRHLKPSSEHTRSNKVNEETRSAPRQDKDGKSERQMRRKTRVRSANKNFPIRVDSLQAIRPSPPSYEEAMDLQRREHSVDATEAERQNTLKMLENHISANGNLQQHAATHIAGLPPGRQASRDRRPPSKVLAPHQLSQDDSVTTYRRRGSRCHSRSASIPSRQEEIYSRPPSIAKAQAVLGISEPGKTSIEQLFDQAVLEFQQQTAETAERMSYRNDIGLTRWATNSARKTSKLPRDEEAAADAPIYVPGKSWRPTAKIHRHFGNGNSQGVKISTPGLAKRLGVPVGTHTALRIDAFYDND
ncbi:hypothetical protein CKM354_001051900 [Cercospora kikuchii]|uniref:Uncharacterized protein n=1 Tax=Cercospora kikuchii TaxID=84275 RepID=A0A9P3CZ63_9PEZI|nr:uncharacterized protein CKM354_001051900 [Cercospora kikuchii]GIZ47428.1 hypothetical protein CKM354_001051900 [Cercospora kikuchii]